MLNIFSPDSYGRCVHWVTFASIYFSVFLVAAQYWHKRQLDQSLGNGIMEPQAFASCCQSGCLIRRCGITVGDDKQNSIEKVVAIFLVV